jgi:hypothetical protein
MASRLSRAERIGVVFSAVWIFVVTAFLAGAGGAWEYILPNFLIVGVLPLIIGWGIYWVKKR